MSYVRLHPDQFNELVKVIKESGGGSGEFTPEEKLLLLKGAADSDQFLQGIYADIITIRGDTLNIDDKIAAVKTVVDQNTNSLQGVRDKVDLTDTHVLTVGSNVVAGNSRLDQLLARPYPTVNISNREMPLACLGGVLLDVTNDTVRSLHEATGALDRPMGSVRAIQLGNKVQPQLSSSDWYDDKCFYTF